jgi:cyclopropane fatty-acyl-phospholipid synthase-like methyltransferase
MFARIAVVGVAVAWQYRVRSKNLRHVKKKQYAKAEPLASRKKDFLRRLVSKTRTDYKAKTHHNDIAPFSPSPDDMVEKVLLKLKPTAEDTMVDLGCGDARWLLQASKRFGCTCVGIELDESLVVKAQQSVVDEKLSELITIKKGDIYEENISDATIVVVYAFAKVATNLHFIYMASSERSYVGFCM